MICLLNDLRSILCSHAESWTSTVLAQNLTMEPLGDAVFGDDIFHFVSRPRHLKVLHKDIKPYFREDCFSGGRPFTSYRLAVHAS